MKRTLEIKARRDDMLVGTLETDSPLFQALPKGSVAVLKPTGKDARSDMELGTLRREWAEFQEVEPDSYKTPGTVTVEFNPLGEIGTLRNAMATALGLPPAALSLKLPDRTPANPKSKVSTFLSAWDVH